MNPIESPAAIDGGRAFAASSGGRWAGERLLAAMKEGRKLSPAELRTLDTLPYNSWIEFDQVAVREGLIKAPLFGMVLAAGLSRPIANAMGKTIYQYDRLSNMTAAVVSLDGLARDDNDRVEFDHVGVPLPITHKDFNISLRTLETSRNTGEPLDTTQVGLCGQMVGEGLDRMLLSGGPTFGGLPIYGLLNHPNRNTGGFGTNGNWSQAAKVGADMFNDINNACNALRQKRFYGPYWVVIPAFYDAVIDADYKALGDRTIRERLMQINGVEQIICDYQMPADNIIIFQATRDVVVIANGEGIQTIQWDIYGGMAVAFKVFAIQVPVVRATEALRSGVYHIS